MGILFFTCAILLVEIISPSYTTYVEPSTFLDSRLSKGSWISKKDIVFGRSLFEGGWIWKDSGNLQVTHICRARTGIFEEDVSITPGQLVNGTCYVSGKASTDVPSGVSEFHNYEVLMKLDNEVYEWVDFDRERGIVHHGAIIGGIGTNYEPIMVCRKVYHGTAGNVQASKAVLGSFKAQDGKCFVDVEMELGSKTKHVTWDMSVATEHFQLLILRARDGMAGCSDTLAMS